VHCSRFHYEIKALEIATVTGHLLHYLCSLAATSMNPGNQPSPFVPPQRRIKGPLLLVVAAACIQKDEGGETKVLLAQVQMLVCGYLHWRFVVLMAVSSPSFTAHERADTRALGASR
jgi:hypothetical protein